MWKIAIVTFLLLPAIVTAQTECPHYNSKVIQGQNALKAKDPIKAFEFFRNAQIEGRLCHLKSTIKADDGIKKAFDALNSLKIRAEESEKMAIDALDELSKSNKEKAMLKAENESWKLQALKIAKDSLKGAQADTAASAIALVMKTTFIEKVANEIGVEKKGKGNVSRLHFYTKVKSVVDTLSTITKKANFNFNNTQDNELFMNAVTDRLEIDFYNNEVAKLLLDSSKKELKNKKEEAEDFDLLLYVYLRAALYYSWKLADFKEFEAAKRVLDEAEKLAGTVKTRSEVYYYSYAGLQNGFNNFYSTKGLEKDAFEYIGKAIENIAIAVLKNPNNSLYQRGLSIYIRNATLAPDSVLSENDRRLLSALGCKCADNIITFFPKSGSSLDALTTCVLDEANEKIAMGKYNEVVKTLGTGINRISAQIKFLPGKKNVFLQKARLYAQLSTLYLRNLRDTLKCKNYLDSAIAEWSLVLTDEYNPINNFRQFEAVYNAITTTINNLSSPKDKEIFIEKLLAATTKFSNYYIKHTSAQYVLAVANKNKGELLEERKTKADSLIAYNYFANSIRFFEQGNLLKKYSDFSEDFAKFCKPYSECVKISVNSGDLMAAEKIYNRMFDLFGAVYKAYPFDFYLIQHLKSAAMIYGEQLYAKKEFAKAIPVLEFASFEGDKASSERLVKIYGEKGFADDIKRREVDRRSKYQSQGMKKFTIPTFFGQTKAPVDIYVVDRDSLYTYRGIEDQVEWVEKALGGIIPDDVRRSFITLQRLAWKNDVSFGELSVYALEAANEEKFLAKYKPLKDSIIQASSQVKKEKFYVQLFDTYEKDIRTDTASKKTITKNALEFYNDYTAYLLTNRKDGKASEVIKRILEIDPLNKEVKKHQFRLSFNENASYIDIIGKTNNLEELKAYLGFYLDLGETEKASILTQKILDIQDSPKIRDEISEIYLAKTMDSYFDFLFLADKSRIKEYRNYFLEKSVSTIKSNKLKRLHYFNLIELDKALLALSPSEEGKKTLSTHYNSFVWYSLLSGNYENLIYYLNKSVLYDSTSLYPYSNLPHVYLFNNDFEKAKLLYLKYKDLPFDKTAGYPTFKDAFLSDFKDFEKEGLMNDNTREVVKLITGN